MNETINEAKDFVSKIPIYPSIGNPAWFIQIGNRTERATGRICHADFLNRKGLSAVGSGFIFEKGDSIGNKFLDFIMNKDLSPWRTITNHKSFEIVSTEKGTHGWVLGPEGIKDLNFKLIKNFAILTRTFYEKRDNFKFWSALVSEGMNPVDAMYLCSFFTLNGHGISSSGTMNISGGHWALTDMPPDKFFQSFYYLDWKRFRSGKISYEGKRGINSCFCHKTKDNPKDYKPFGQNLVPTEKGKGNFSYYNIYKIENIIKVFYEWQSKMGIYNGT